MIPVQQKEVFCFDGQLHIPIKRIEETLSTAIDRGLDAVVFTNYGNTSNFDLLINNRDQEGQSILTPHDWDVQGRSPTVIELSTEKGRIYVLKGGEVKTKQGHLLVWGIEQSIQNGLNIDESLRATYRQGGVAVFPHLLTLLFHGCGREVFQEMYVRFKDYPLGVEQNGQVPSNYLHNEKVGKLAEEYGIACFGTSDIHGDYLQEHKKIGIRYYSSIRKVNINPDYLTESLRVIMLSDPHAITIKGTANRLIETVLWNLSSIRHNGLEKLVDLCSGYKNVRKVKPK